MPSSLAMPTRRVLRASSTASAVRCRRECRCAVTRPRQAGGAMPRSSIESAPQVEVGEVLRRVMPSATVRLPGPRQRRGVITVPCARRAAAHQLDALERLERANQHRGRRSFRFGHRVHEIVNAVVQVDVGAAGRPVERRVAPRRAGRGVTGRIGLADVGLGLDDDARRCAGRGRRGRAPCR